MKRAYNILLAITFLSLSILFVTVAFIEFNEVNWSEDARTRTVACEDRWGNEIQELTCKEDYYPSEENIFTFALGITGGIIFIGLVIHFSVEVLRE